MKKLALVILGSVFVSCCVQADTISVPSGTTYQLDATTDYSSSTFDLSGGTRALTGVPLVMHGGSGISPEDYRTAISCGVRKINYYSYMARAGKTAVAEKLAAGDVTFFHSLAAEATKAMEGDVARAMGVFYKNPQK